MIYNILLFFWFVLLPSFSGYFNTGNRRTWIIGDSIVRWAGLTKVQLEGGGEVYWNGISGARLAGVDNRLRNYLAVRPVPSTIILHLGTNDIFTEPSWRIRARLAENVSSIRELLPNTRLIWSDIIPRLFYYGETTPGAGKRVTRNINGYARGVCAAVGNAHTISHSSALAPSQYRLFRRDGLHLSDEGLSVFRANLSSALIFFNQNPGANSFPVRDN